ncbi:MAG: RagB/SusD family nutrient uptake outer membrane protein [Bacteroidota bacterium]|nr:RagB/SusD family nutrient uptake outer membrane protein [Candidatus Kapabacteria bacterium]MDW8219026.1 RagB/SusD family nutrient uptake outer membrane protein [Bacteroidota bacterium]
MNTLLRTSLLSVGVTFALVLSACDPLLNVKPVTQIDAATDLKDALAVRVALNGAYDGLSNRYIWGGEVWCYADLMGEENDIRFRGTFQYMGDIWRRTLNTLNSGAAEVWLVGYSTINRVNRILAVIDTLPAAERNSVRGQALFIRAVCYFEMIRLYGKTWGDGDNASNPGVPLVLTPSQIFQTGVLSEGEKPSRASVAAVYEQIIKDLTDAESLLPATSEATRANKATAAAVLSRVYLMQGRYAEARDAANRVISTNRYSLAPTFTEAFRESLPGFAAETIFRVPVSEQDGVNQLNVFYSATPGGRRDMEILAGHLTKYEMNDARRAFFFTVGRRLTSKWVDQFGDIPAIRFAEMLLTRAECNARLGTTVGAPPADDINRIRRRVGLADLAPSAVTIDAILRERRNELAFEGHWLHDKKRTRSSIVSGGTTYPFNSDRLVFPVPNREIIANPNLRQNPGYVD